MIKLCLLSFCLLVVLNCKEANPGTQVAESRNPELVTEGLPAKATINAEARSLVSGWPAFLELENGIDRLYRVENNEELLLLLDELIEDEKALEESEYPELYDTPQIRSRQKVLKTYLLKTKASLEYRTDPQEPAIELITAYNALARQCNVLVNSKLDTELLEDE